MSPQALDASWKAASAELRSSVNEFSKIMAMRAVLSVYREGAQLARDPAHMHLIEPLEQLRLAYEKGFGEPIPPIVR